MSNPKPISLTRIPAGLTASVGATNTDYVAIFQADLV